MKYFVYILTCSDGSLYTGITNDLKRRVSEHNEKIGSRYTRSRLPVILSYSEEYENKPEALKREYEIKRLRRQEKLELVNSADSAKK